MLLSDGNGNGLMSMTFFRSYHEAASELPDAERLAFYDAVMCYYFCGVVPELKGAAKAMFILCKPSLDKSASRAAAGRKGREARESNDDAPEPDGTCSEFVPDLLPVCSDFVPDLLPVCSDFVPDLPILGKGEGIGKGKGKGIGQGKGQGQDIGQGQNTPQFPLRGAGADGSGEPGSQDGEQGQGQGRGKKPDPPGFGEFWAAYPRKAGKGAARKAWQRAKPDAALRAKIMAALEVVRASPQWRKDGGAFVPNPATWLNQERWDDAPLEGLAPPSPRLTPLEAWNLLDRARRGCRGKDAEHKTLRETRWASLPEEVRAFVSPQDFRDLVYSDAGAASEAVSWQMSFREFQASGRWPGPG